MFSPTQAYCLQNLGETFAWWGCCRKPSKSWNTKTCPLVPLPAPIPIVGICSADVIESATSFGTHSNTIAKQPASCSFSAALKISSAEVAVRPWGLKPPRTPIAWGVRPRWPTTAIPALTIVLTVSTRASQPPSSLTASTPPSFTSRMADSSAWFALVSYDPNGRSPTTNVRFVPRFTAWQCVIISWSVIGKVVSWPCTTIAAESPTSVMSKPALSTYKWLCAHLKIRVEDVHELHWDSRTKL